MYKKTIVIVLFLYVSKSYSQDIITLKSGNELRAKITEISETEIKYKKFDYLDGPVFVILKSDVLTIHYENGTEDNLSLEKKNETSDANTNTNLFFKGQSDATKYYKGYDGAGTGTFVVSLLSPLVGLIPAIACSSTSPKDKNLDYPNSEMMRNTDYHNGYTFRAKKIKKNKVWTNWGIAFGINLVLIVLIGAGG